MPACSLPSFCLEGSLGEVAMPFSLPRITASAGVTSYPASGDHVADMLKHADLALYKAKDRGRNCVVSALTDLGAIAAE